VKSWRITREVFLLRLLLVKWLRHEKRFACEIFCFAKCEIKFAFICYSAFHKLRLFLVFVFSLAFLMANLVAAHEFYS